VIRALIVDDEPLARSRVRMLLGAHPDVEVVAECGSGREAAQVMASETASVLFLDIELSGADDGFAIAAATDSGVKPTVVFVTAHEECALRAFDANAVDFLVKPFSQERFDRAMDRVRRFLVAPAPRPAVKPRAWRQRFVIRGRDQVLFVKAASIDWIAAEGNYARLYADEKSYLIRDSLQKLEAELDPELFVRVHRSAIVNIERVRKLLVGAEGAFSLVLRNDAAVPLGPSYRENLEQLLGQKL
jgi:two-component system LytT family response regulator